MRIAILTWLVLAALYLVPFLHSALGYPLTRSAPTPPPNPEITRGDTMADCPLDEEFAAAGYRDIGRGEAYSFTLGGTPTPCDRMWRAAVRSMGWFDRVQLSGPIRGRAGICDWYSLRIVGYEGEVRPGGFVRAGPRRTGQLRGEVEIENPDRVHGVNVRPAGPPSHAIEKFAPGS